MRAIGMPQRITSMTVRTAASTDGKATTAERTASGSPCSFSVSSVMTPSVPSEPTSRRVRS